MDSAKYVTQHKRININIGKKNYKKKEATLAHKYTVDLINNNINNILIQIFSLDHIPTPKPNLNHE